MHGASSISFWIGMTFQTSFRDEFQSSPSEQLKYRWFLLKPQSWRRSRYKSARSISHAAVGSALHPHSRVGFCNIISIPHDKWIRWVYFWASNSSTGYMLSNLHQLRISCLTEKRAACCKPDPTPNSATAIGKIQGLQTSRNCSKYADLSKRCGYQIARRITLLSNFDGNHKRL